tara:strand:- start:109 stop:492 length:384 start_codon:yes stop_codon:yes gene_type:complete
MQEGKIRYKANHIEMCDYFKYSGKIEESKSMNQWLKLEQARTPIDNPMVAFYFENPDYNIAEVAKVFEVSDSTIRCILNYHFKKRRENIIVIKKDLKVETTSINSIDIKTKSIRVYNDMSKYKLKKK